MRAVSLLDIIPLGNSITSCKRGVMKRVFYLIGYRAVGKTTIGRRLAEELDLRFEDTDKLVEKRCGQTIASFVDQSGWKSFRKIEKQILEQTASMNDVLVSTGGGAVLHEDIWRKIRQAAGVIWLRAEPSIILSRLKTDEMTSSQRPSLSDNGVFAEVEEILQERTPLYSALADYILDTDKMTVDEAVAAAADWCRNRIQTGE